MDFSSTSFLPPLASLCAKNHPVFLPKPPPVLDPCGFSETTSLFPECPIPSGPFGFDAGLLSLVRGNCLDQLLNYSKGADWLAIMDNLDSDAEAFALLVKSLREYVAPQMEFWNLQLCEGPLLQESMRIYTEAEAAAEIDRVRILRARFAG